MRRAKYVAVDHSEPVAQGDMLEGFSHVSVFQPGHPLRRSRCLACASLIGSRPVRIYTIVCFTVDNCTCGSIPTISYLVCADHGTDPGAALAQLALQRWERHHGKAD